MYGGTFEAPWEYLPESHIFILNVTWRFGPGVCTFLNTTCQEYRTPACNLRSPLKLGDAYTPQEKDRVPDTWIRFVIYHDTVYYGSKFRGHMVEEHFHIRPSQDIEEDPEEEAMKLRVAGSKGIFVNVLHEGFTFLGELSQGKIKMHALAAPIPLKADNATLIATMFYGNDVIV